MENIDLTNRNNVSETGRDQLTNKEHLAKKAAQMINGGDYFQQNTKIRTTPDSLEKAAQTVQQWVSVDDKEPPLDTTVLICWADSPEVEPEKDHMTHDADHGVDHWANFNEGDEPSHWMPLPVPYKAQEQK